MKTYRFLKWARCTALIAPGSRLWFSVFVIAAATVIGAAVGVDAGDSALSDVDQRELEVAADQVIYRRRDGGVILSGGVVIYDPSREMFYRGEDISLFPEQQLVVAEGNVAIYDEISRDNFFMEHLRFFYGGKGAIGHGQRIRGNILDGRLLFSARQAMIRQGGVVVGEGEGSEEQYSLADFWLTPCATSRRCFDEYIWEFSGRQGEYASGQVRMKDAELRVCGMKMLRLRDFNLTMADNRPPTGFFFPKVYSISHEGMAVRIPYHWNVSRNLEVVVAPHLGLSRMLPLIYELQVKHRLPYGGYGVKINASQVSDSSELQNGLEGLGGGYSGGGGCNHKLLNRRQSGKHLDMLLTAKGNFYLPEKRSEFGFDINKLFDKNKTYAKKYLDNYEDILSSKAYYHYSYPERRGYFAAEGVLIDDLRPYSPYKNMVNVPRMSLLYEMPVRQFGQWDFSQQISANAENLRDDGDSSLAISNIVNFAAKGNLEYNFNSGAQFGLRPALLFQAMSSDYWNSHVAMVPQLDLTLQKSWLSQVAGGLQTIEPAFRINLIPASKISVGPLDQQFLEYQAPGVFAHNLRYRINNQNRTGPNFDYGVEWRYNGEIEANLLVGGNRRFYGDGERGRDGESNLKLQELQKTISPGSAIYRRTDRNSAYNLQGLLKVGNNSLAARTWLRPDKLTPVHVEADWLVNLPKTMLILDYTMFDNQYHYGDRRPLYRHTADWRSKEQEIGGEFWRKISSELWLNLNARSKLNNGRTGSDLSGGGSSGVGGGVGSSSGRGAGNLVSAGLGMRYQVDCLRIDFGIKKNNIEIRDLEPSLTYYVNFGVPILGF